MKDIRLLPSFFFKRNLGYVVCFFILLAISVGLSLSPRGQAATNKFYDPIRTTASRNEVVIIGIDDKSLKEYGAWPWERDIFAKLTKILREAGAKAIAYDVLFLEPRAGDDDFQKELLASSSTIILASKSEGNSYYSSFLSATTTGLINGLANVTPDPDGKVRLYPTGYMQESVCIQPLAKEAFSLYARKAPEPCGSQKILFRYPAHIATYSLVDILNGGIPPENFKDKAIFIGSTALDLNDHFTGMKGETVPGVFVHASIFTSLLNSVRDIPIARNISIILMIFVSFCAALCIALPRSVYRQVLFILLLLAGIVAASAVLFTKGYILPLPWLLETSIISAGFVGLVRLVKEREKNEHIESLFSKYVHKDVLVELLRSGKELKLGGEKKQVSVLFSDIRGFTSLSETLTPEELTSTLNDYLSAMTPHILNQKGTIDKFIGDAIMAFWNAPLDVPHHSLHALRSALSMHKALEAFNEARGTQLGMGIGIHTGNVIVGNVGGQDRVNYTILGDTVNLASRIEGLTKKYGVKTIVTKSVRDLIDDEGIKFRCLDVITVSGKTLPTTLYEARDASGFTDELIISYEKAFKYYYDKEWNKAESIWKKLAKAGDIPSEIMLARIPELRKQIGWDGIWRFDEK